VQVLASPAQVTVLGGESVQPSATVSGNPSAEVSWPVGGTGCPGSACGTVSPAGLFTAPPTPSHAILYLVEHRALRGGRPTGARAEPPAPGGAPRACAGAEAGAALERAGAAPYPPSLPGSSASLSSTSGPVGSLTRRALMSRLWTTSSALRSAKSFFTLASFTCLSAPA
jgi:hypothetical protein